MSERYDRLRRLFDEAEPLDADARTSFLDRECADDPGLRTELEELLGTRERVGGFLQQGAVAWSGRRIGGYEIEDVIAEGGMGLVLRARQESPDRAVALKIVRGALGGPRLQQRFELEARALARLEHPGIAQIFEAGTFDAGGEPQPYFAMELVDGEPLTRNVRNAGLDLRSTLRLFIRICEAVHHAHLRGVIHRDLKPSNILVRPDGQPKVLDFGVARLTDVDARLTTIGESTGRIVGTLAYMSPEQVRGDLDGTDVRADVYALGALLYEVVAGRLPHDVAGKEFLEAARVVAEETPGPMGRAGERVPADVETIVATCLRHEPDGRYGSAAELADDLRRFLDEQPIAARPPSTAYHLSKFVRRNRGAVIGSTAAVLALVAGLVVSLLGWGEARRSTRAAEESAAESREVVGFLVDILSAPDPYFDGPDVKVADVLDRATDRVPDEFADREELAAHLHGVLGQTYRSMGMYPEADAQFRRTLELIEGVSDGDADPRLARPLEKLSSLLLDANDLDGADSLLVRAEAAAASLPRDDLYIYRIAQSRAWIAEMRGDMKTAAALLEAALVDARAAFGEEGGTVLDLELALGGVLWQDDDPERARALMEPAIEALTEELGPENPAVLINMSNLCMVYQALEEWELARSTLEHTTETRRRTLGPDHPDTAIGDHNLAHLLREMGEPAEAVPHHEAAIAVFENAGPERAVHLAMFRAGYGKTLLVLERPDEALAQLEAAHPVLVEAFGADHSRVAALADDIEALRNR